MLRLLVTTSLLTIFSMLTFAQQSNSDVSNNNLPVKPEPIVVYDGIIVPSGIAEILLSTVYQYKIDDVTILEDSIYDCTGKLTNLGIVRIHSIASENLAAKKIMSLTKNWLFTNPLTNLEINKTPVAWDERTYLRLISLGEEDVISAKIKMKNGDSCDATLKLRVK